MTEEELKKQQEEQKKLEEQAKQMDDLEIAKLANEELKKKEKEILDLKKQLAKEKLLSQADEEERELPSREDCLKVINSNQATNYDYAQAVLDLVDNARNENQPNPLGKNGDAVYDFFKECIEECDGDKNRFTAIYQSKLGEDDLSVQMAYNKRNRK